MDPIKPKFFQTAFEVEKNGLVLTLQGLVSVSGITKIHLTKPLPTFWQSVMGESVTVTIENMHIKGVMLQQLVEHGSFLEIKFRELAPASKAHLEQRIQSDGIRPGWQRKYPRIPVKGAEDPELPMPNLGMVRFVGQEVFVNVVNFTLGGIRIETLGDSLAELRVGAQLHFDLVVSTGDILTNLNAEVRNISTHDNVVGGTRSLTRSFGLRFINLDPVNERKYRALIKDYCLILKKRLDLDDEP